MFLKWLFDKLVSVIGLVVLSPVLLVVAILIKKEMPGPVLFRQKRVGQHGRLFTVYKFRSMTVKAEASVASKDSEVTSIASMEQSRITPLGEMLRRYKLDELPELWNVLKGDMSFVGPRPIVEDEKKKYGDKFRYIFSVTPGLSGMWQISGRSSTGYEERVMLDTYYIQNWSIWLDIWIILQTALVVITRKGAY